jgi:hypothetical protein
LSGLDQEPQGADGVATEKETPRMTISEAVRLRALAAEALTIGATMTEPNCKRMMIKLAASYERLAEHAEKREAARPSDGASLSNAQSRASDGKRRPLPT